MLLPRDCNCTHKGPSSSPNSGEAGDRCCSDPDPAHSWKRDTGWLKTFVEPKEITVGFSIKRFTCNVEKPFA